MKRRRESEAGIAMARLFLNQSIQLRIVNGFWERRKSHAPVRGRGPVCSLRASGYRDDNASPCAYFGEPS
jgi:hypothetical protein